MTSSWTTTESIHRHGLIVQPMFRLDCLMPLEVLHFPFVLFGLLQGGKCAEVPTLTCLRIFASRIQAKLSGFEFANHEER